MKNKHKKKFSRDLYAELKAEGLLPQEFARKHVDQATWALEERIEDNDPLEPLYPNADAFLQWTQEHGLTERVRKGVYRFVQEEPEEDDLAEDHFNYREGMASEEEPVVTDMDPEHPMVLGHDDRYMDPPSDEENPMILNLTIDNVPRLPRKMKKRMKRELIRNTGAKKVGLTFAPEWK